MIEVALKESEEDVHPLLRAVNRAALADLLLELGELKRAKALARQAARFRKSKPVEQPEETVEGLFGGFVEGVFQMIGTSTTIPYVIDVLVRCDEVEAACELIAQFPDLEALWSSLAASCAAAGRLDEIEKRMKSFDSAERKVFLCVGAIDGLKRRPYCRPE